MAGGYALSLFDQLVAAAIHSGATTIITRDTRVDILLPTERPLYDFVITHTNRYGQLPSVATLEQGGFELPEVSDSPLFYLDRIFLRGQFNAINDLHPAFRDALIARNVPVAVERLREMVNAVSPLQNTEQSSTTLHSEITGVVEDYDQRRHQSGLAGITLGWDTLDEATLGAMGGDIIVIVGRPSMGKSWMLFEMAFNAWTRGSSIAIISMEMSKKQVVRRWMGRHLGINPNLIRAGQLSAWAERDIHQYTEMTRDMPRISIISGDMEKNISVIEDTIREWSPDIIYVDAAYLLTPSGGGKYQSKWESIAKVVSDLKKLAIRYNRPIVISMQLNRNQKTKNNADVDMGDIAGSDSVGQDASVIIAIQQGIAPHESSRRQLTVLKNREGENPVFSTNFTFSPPNFSEVTDTEIDIATGWEV